MIKQSSYWWEAAPPASVGEGAPVPAKADVVIVGGGYSGMSIGLFLARAGRDVVILEQDKPGQHASTVNFGAAGRTIRPKFSSLQEQMGTETAIRIFTEAKEWMEFCFAFIRDEKIDCNVQRPGRLYGAHTPEAYESMARDLELQKKHIPTDGYMVPRAEQHKEIGSDTFFGLHVLADVGQLHSGRYFLGMRERAEAAGVRILSNCRADQFRRDGGLHTIKTSRGTIQAKELVLCTNAQTGDQDPLLRKFRRRILPIYSWTAVTEPLDQKIIDAITPKGRMMLESVLLYTGLRTVDEQNRLLVTARHLFHYANVEEVARDVKAQVAGILPDFDKVKISHCWDGSFALTFDWLPHLGFDRDSGAYYQLGMVGTGVPSTVYFGWKTANRILGKTKEAETVFADRTFATKPFFHGGPHWILPLARSYYRARDNGARDRALKKYGRQTRPA